jgi:hypothetical protein
MTTTTEAPAYGVSNDAITISVVHKPGGQVDSVIDVTWCISPDLRAELVAKEVTEPLLLLTVTHDHEEMDRYVVPLLAEKWQIRFRHPGTNTVYGVVIWSKGESAAKIRRVTTKTGSNGGYRRSVMSELDPELQRLSEAVANLKSSIGGNEHFLAQHDPDTLGLAIDTRWEGPEDHREEAMALRREVAERTRTLKILAGTYEEPEPAAPEELATTTAELDQLRAELAELEPAYAARRDNPVTEYLWHDSFYGLGNSEISISRSDNTGELDVEIPAAMFAKEPPKWMKKLGTRYQWPYPAKDECQLRGRALATAATLWPRAIGVGIAAGFMEVVDLIVLLPLLLVGMRSIHYKVLRHPLTYSPRDFWLRRGNSSIWFTKVVDPTENDGERLAIRHPVICLLNPLTFTIAGVIGLVIWALTSSFHWFFIGFEILFGLVVVLYLLKLIFNDRTIDWMSSLGTAHTERKDARRQRALNEAERELADLSCDNGAGKSDARPPALPRRRRVAYIAFDIKAKVCRPFAG